MAYRDYVHCEKCDCKLIYDGYDNIRDDLQQKFNLPDDKWTTPLMCPNCLKQLKYELDQLKKTCALVPKCEVWIDGKLDKIYRGQTAIDVETGKIQIPKGAVIKTWDY